MPFATSTDGVHFPPTKWESQMPTSGLPSPVPPNQAATSSCPVVSTIVEAWLERYGAASLMKSACRNAGLVSGESAAKMAPVITGRKAQRTNARPARSRKDMWYLKVGGARGGDAKRH